MYPYSRRDRYLLQTLEILQMSAWTTDAVDPSQCLNLPKKI